MAKVEALPQTPKGKDHQHQIMLQRHGEAQQQQQQEQQQPHGYRIHKAIVNRDATALRIAMSQFRYDGYSKLSRRNHRVSTKGDSHQHHHYYKNKPSDDDDDDEEEEYMYSPIKEVMRQGDAKCLQVLLDYHCEALLDVGTDHSYSAKHYACQKGNIECLRVLLAKHQQEYRVAPDLLHGKPFLTPLHTVVEYWDPARESSYAACVQVLLEYQADPTRVDYLGTDVLTKACSKGLVQAVEVLFATGHATLRVPRRRYSALHAAAASLHVELVQLLLRHKAPRKHARMVNTCDRTGNGPLHHVIRVLVAGRHSHHFPSHNKNDQNHHKHADHDSLATAAVAVARCLLQAGANVNNRNDRGDTVLLMLLRDWQQAHRAVLDVLLEYGASVQDSVESTSKASFSKASSSMDTTVAYREKIFVEAALRHGPVIQQRGLIPRPELCATIQVAQHDATGWTPLHYAAFYGDADVTRKLLQRGADAHARDGRGRTPLAVATGLVLEATTSSPTDLDTVALRAHGPDDVLPMEAEDLSLANNFAILSIGDDERTKASAVSLLLEQDVSLTQVDGDGNLPFFLAAGLLSSASSTAAAAAAAADSPMLLSSSSCDHHHQTSDLSTLYQVVKAGSEQGLFRNVSQGLFHPEEKNKSKNGHRRDRKDNAQDLHQRRPMNHQCGPDACVIL